MFKAQSRLCTAGQVQHNRQLGYALHRETTHATSGNTIGTARMQPQHAMRSLTSACSQQAMPYDAIITPPAVPNWQATNRAHAQCLTLWASVEVK